MLPPNQRAVLLLRDVLGYRAAETADLLGLSVDAVTSASKRARSTLAAPPRGRPAPPPPGSAAERELLDRFVIAFTELDVDRLIALMTDDVWVRMPPAPFEYHGRAAAHEFFTAVDAHRRETDRLIPTRANGQPAWGEYRRDPVTGVSRLAGIKVVGLAGVAGRLARLGGRPLTTGCSPGPLSRAVKPSPCGVALIRRKFTRSGRRPGDR